MRRKVKKKKVYFPHQELTRDVVKMIKKMPLVITSSVPKLIQTSDSRKRRRAKVKTISRMLAH